MPWVPGWGQQRTVFLRVGFATYRGFLSSEGPRLPVMFLDVSEFGFAKTEFGFPLCCAWLRGQYGIRGQFQILTNGVIRNAHSQAVNGIHDLPRHVAL